MMKLPRFPLFWTLVGLLLLAIGLSPTAQTTLANNAADLAGKIVMVADSTTARTVTNLFTFNRSPSAPFAVAASSGKVTNLDADLLDGVEAAALRGYTLFFGASQFSPADATIYYFGLPLQIAQGTSAGTRRVYLPRAGVLTRVELIMYNNAGTLGTTETSTIAILLNGTTATTVSATIDNSATQYYNISGLSVTVVAGDYIELRWTTPTWSTNPTNVLVQGYVYIE